MNKKYVFTAIVGLVTLSYLALVIHYKKYENEWFGINILLISGLFAGITIFIFTKLRWFQHGGPTSYKMLAIPVAGLILSVFLGLHYTEQPAIVVRQSDYQYSYALSRTGYMFSNLNIGSVSDSDSSVDIDFDDAEGEAVAYLFLIILVVVLVVGSAFIPHFWVASCAILLAVMGIMTYREYLLE